MHVNCILILALQLVCSGIIKFCLRGMLKDQQRLTLFSFLDAVFFACSESIVASQVAEIQARMNHALALLERDFPMSIQVCVC